MCSFSSWKLLRKTENDAEACVKQRYPQHYKYTYTDLK